MARGDRQRTVRQKDDFRQGRRDVVLQESRRFFTSQGNTQSIRQAKALTAALNVGVEAYAGSLERKNVKGEARAVQEAAAGGERQETDANKGYNDTFDTIEAENDLASFAAELPQILQEKGWADMGEEDAQGIIDNYYAGQLAGINPDSVYGKTVAAGILEQNKELLKTHRIVEMEKAQQERRIMVFDAVRSEYETTGTIDHVKLMKRLKIMVPGPGGRATYLESVFQLSEEFGAPELIETIPDYFPGGDPTGKTDPNMDDLFQQKLEKAQAVQTANLKAADDAFNLANRNDIARIHALDTKMAENGDARVLPNIEAGTKRGPDNEPAMYSREQANALYDAFLDSTEQNADNDILLDDYINGQAVGESQAGIDAAHVMLVDLLKNNIPDEVSAQGDDAIEAYVLRASLDRGVVNGKLPSTFKQQMNVNLSNPDKFQDAAEMYTIVETIEPGFVETQLNDKQSAKLYAYNRYLVDTKGNAQQAIELMGTHEHGRNSQFNTEIGKVNKDTTLKIVEERVGPIDFATTSRLRALVDQETRFYVDAGFEPEDAGEAAFNHIMARTRRAGDHLYAPDAGWGNKPQLVYDFAIENEAAHRGIPAKRLEIIPTGDPERVRFRDKDFLVPEPKTYPISFFADLQRQKASEYNEQRSLALETSTDEMMVEAEKRAFIRRFPYRTYAGTEERAYLYTQDRKRWVAMDPVKKERLIADELVKQQQAQQ